MDIKRTFGKIFEKGNPGLGWFVMWRMALVMVPLNVVSRIAIETSPNPLGAIGTLFALPIGGNVFLVPIAIPVTLFLWHWLGRMAMVKRLGVSPRGFVGWALYWRFVLLQLSGVIALGLVLAPVGLIASNFGEAGMVTFSIIAAVVGLPGLIYWNLNVIGFVVKRVAARMPRAEAEAEAAPAGSRLRIRSHRLIFDEQSFGMNWMIAGAYIGAGLVISFILPFVRGAFSGELRFEVFEILHVMLISWVITGFGLAFLLHRIKEDWLIVLILTLLMVASRVLVEAPLLNLGSDQEWNIFNMQSILLRASFGFFMLAGLMAGIRVGGPTVAGMGLGMGIGGAIHSLFMLPLIVSSLADFPVEAFMHWQRVAESLVGVAIDAGVTGFALWWACDWHLSRRKLRLTQDGSIVPRGARGPAPAGGA